MAEPVYSHWPGCGVRLPVVEDNRDGRYNASAARWQLNGELNASTLTRGDRESAFVHQLQVDAYGAHHIAVGQRRIGPAFALIGLYLTCERGYAGQQAQHTHMLPARRSKSWPQFAPPTHGGDVTVLDVMQAPPGEERNAAREGKAKVPPLAIYATRKKLQEPSYAEGFDALYTVRIADADGSRFQVQPWVEEAANGS